MKLILAAVLAVSSAPALACSMTATGYDAFRLSTGLTTFVENNKTDFEIRINEVRINKDNLVLVESTKAGQCTVTAYSVTTSASCAPQVTLAKTSETCGQ